MAGGSGSCDPNRETVRLTTVNCAMSVTFSIPIDEIPDALDLEPDVADVDWIEDDPDLTSGPVHLYVHGSSTVVVTIVVSEAMTLDVHVPFTASPADWALALDVVEMAMGQADTVLVEVDGGEPVTLDELRALCNREWQGERAASAVRALRVLADSRVARAQGPVRPAHIGPRVMAELTADNADDTEQGRRLLAVLGRVQWVTGPHDRAAAMEVTDNRGVGFSVAVIGPLLRYVLPPTDRLLVENGNLASDAGELMIPSDALASLPGVRITWLDDGNRLMDAVPESAWPAVVAAAEAHRFAG